MANVLAQLAVFVPALSDDVPAAAKVVSLEFAHRRRRRLRPVEPADLGPAHHHRRHHVELVSSVPAVVAAPSGAIAVIGAVIVVMCIALLVPLWSKPLKDGVRTGATAA